MKDVDFKKVSETLRQQAHRIISKPALFRVAASSGFLEACTMLTQNSDYDFSKAETLPDAEQVLDKGLEDLYAYVYSVTPHDIVVDILSTRYDYSNLSSALKASCLQEESPHFMLASPIPAEEFEAFADPKNDLFESRLPSHLLNGGLDARALYEETESASVVKTYLDRQMYGWMLALAESLGNDFIVNYIKACIDFYNISVLIEQRIYSKQRSFLEPFFVQGGRIPAENISSKFSRSAPAVIPSYYHKYFGEALQQEVSRWEKKSDPKKLHLLLSKLLFSMTEKVDYISYGVEVVFAYILSREEEIQTIRLLLRGKKKGTSPEEIKEDIINPFLKEP